MVEVVGRVILAVLGGLVAIFALIALVWGFQWVTAPFRGELEQRERVLASGDYRIAAYDSFYEQCQSIRALEGNLDVQAGELKGAEGKRRERLEINLTGLQAQRFSAIEQYNAEARQEATAGQFRASDLPYQIPAESWTEGYRTSCDA